MADGIPFPSGTVQAPDPSIDTGTGPSGDEASGLRVLADGVEEAVGHVAAQGLMVIPFDRGRLEGFAQRGGILCLLGGLGGHLHDLSVK